MATSEELLVLAEEVAKLGARCLFLEQHGAVASLNMAGEYLLSAAREARPAVTPVAVEELAARLEE